MRSADQILCFDARELPAGGEILAGGAEAGDGGATGSNVTLTDGSVMNVDLREYRTVTAKFTLLSSPVTAAPEPASMLVLGASLL